MTVTELCSNAKLDEEVSTALSEASVLLMVSARLTGLPLLASPYS